MSRRWRGVRDGHDEFRLLAAAAVDGRLDPDSAAALTAHLAICDACRADQAAMLADHSMLAEPAAAVMPRYEIRAFVLDAARAPRVPRIDEGRAARLPMYAVISLVVLIAVVGLGLGGMNQFFGARATGSSEPPSQPSSVSSLPATPSAAPATPRASAPPPALSASPVPRVGGRIALQPTPPPTFPADTAFHLGQGFCYDETDENALQMVFDPGTHIDFFIDGVLQDATREVFAPINQCVVGAAWIVNVPAGLPAGTHRFDAIWYNVGILDQSRSAEILFE